MVGDQVNSFVITRDELVSLISCKLHLQGHIFDVLEYLNVVGRGAGLCRITPAQADLIEAADKKRKGLDDTQSKISVDGEVVAECTTGDLKLAAEASREILGVYLWPPLLAVKSCIKPCARCEPGIVLD